MEKEIKQLMDVHHQVHRLAGELGRGGQGVVYKTNDPDLVIKLVTDTAGNPINDPDQVKKYQNNLSKLKLLPIGRDIHIAKPLFMLEGYAGYVMQLVRDMHPFSELLAKKANKQELEGFVAPTWLSSMKKEDAYSLFDYAKTGSTKRRLDALTQCATQLAKLHGVGLVYGDISPENVFISKSTNYNHVWLIDADNLRFESKKGLSVYTPSYGAPEVVQGIESGSSRSDCHAFSVMAFKILSMLHPFIGELVLDDSQGWDDADESALDIEEQAFAGLLPYIDDPQDSSNCNNSGLPRFLILTPELVQLFEESFCAGRKHSWQRPTIYHWPKALAQAVDLSIECDCNMTYFDSYAEEHGECPYCEEATGKKIIAQTYQWLGDDGLGELRWQWSAKEKNKSFWALPKRVFTLFQLADHEISFMEIVQKGEHYFFELNFTHQIAVSWGLEGEKDSNFTPLNSKLALQSSQLKQGVWFYIGSDTPLVVKIKIGE